LPKPLFPGDFCKFDGASHDYSEDVFAFLVGHYFVNRAGALRRSKL
jgi:hypothetical protein